MLASKSRFAVLPDDDPADAPVPKTKKNKNKTANNANNANGKSNKKSKGKANDDDDLKALAFGGKTKKGNNQKKKNNAKNGNSTGSPSKEATPDADWVARDEENVRELYQEDLQKAIMESKLAYMETHNGQEAPPATAKTAPPGMTAMMPKGAKKKGQTTVSLDQFQAGMSAALPQPITVPVKTSGEELRANFFESIKKDATKEMDREARRELLERSAKSGPPPTATKPNGAPPSSPLKTVAEVQATLALRAENETLRADLATSKARCKRLLSLIAECDMKERAQLIIEVEKLRQVRDELTTHVTALTGELEQQKSRAQEMAKELRNNGQGKKISSSAN